MGGEILEVPFALSVKKIMALIKPLDEHQVPKDQRFTPEESQYRHQGIRIFHNFLHKFLRTVLDRKTAFTSSSNNFEQ